MTVDLKKEITIQNSLFSALKSGYHIMTCTKGMEKFDKKNLVIIAPEIFVYKSEYILYSLADYILNHYKEDINIIELFDLKINEEYPPINLKLISINNIPHYLVSSKNVLENITKLVIEKGIKVQTEDSIKLSKPKLYAIKGGKT